MRLSKHVLTGVAACTLTASVLGGPSAAVAATPTKTAPGITGGSSAPQSSYTESQFVKLGVPDAARPGLRAKIARGELPDADKGAAPVKTTEIIFEGAPATRSTYRDGSVSISAVGAAESDSEGMSRTQAGNITECTGQTSDGAQTFRDNCKVSFDATTWSASYYLKQLGYGTYGYATGPFGKAAGGAGIQASNIFIYDAGGGGSAQAWVRIDLVQQYTVGGQDATRDVGFDLKLKTGYSITSFTA